MLVPVRLLANLKYVAWNFPGALNSAWLQEEVHERLLRADALVFLRSGGRAQIEIWDALRSFETQQHLFDREIGIARARYPDLGQDELEALVSNFVRPPRRDLPPPHTTGGAVDVTLLRDGDDRTLGIFDDFSDVGRADYYDNRLQLSADEARQKEGRDLVRTAMFEVGFVGIPEEHWHYEYGTRLWAQQTGNKVLFDTIVEPPLSDAFADRLPLFRSGQVVDVRGAAQIFSSVAARASALSGKTKGYYYARTRHHNERQAAAKLAAVVGTEDAIFTPSGLSAALIAVASAMPAGGTLLIDSLAYYETASSLAQIGGERGWSMKAVDLSDTVSIALLFAEPIDVIFCDHPRNWMLTTPDLKALRHLADHHHAKLIVDTSVQPLQRLAVLGLADIITLSLSKYPSMGETVAGAILGSSGNLEGGNRLARRWGIVLPPEAAATILQHLPTLVDRMDAVSFRAITVANFLREQDCIAEVRLPDLGAVNAVCGGQLSCRFTSPAIAAAVEEVVGWNAGRGDQFPLGLACTFGAAFTTFEHFGSRISADGADVLGADVIGPGWVRIGLGYEPIELIVDALRFAIDTADRNALAA